MKLRHFFFVIGLSGGVFLTFFTEEEEDEAKKKMKMKNKRFFAFFFCVSVFFFFWVCFLFCSLGLCGFKFWLV